MGGAVPLGYRVKNRALHVVEEEAEFVRALFRRYLEIGSVVRLKTALDAGCCRRKASIGNGRRRSGRAIARRSTSASRLARSFQRSDANGKRG